MKYQLYNGDCLDVLETLEPVDTLFADPPDNIGLGYDSYRDRLNDGEYVAMLRRWLQAFVLKARTVWLSYNSKWTFEMGKIVSEIVGLRARDVEAKPCIQTFTFGQHNHHDLGNNHRPLLRLRWPRRPALPGRHPRAVMAARERRQAGRSPRAHPRRRVRLHPRRGQQQAAPHLAPHTTQRGPGRAMRQADYAGWWHSPGPLRRHGNDVACV